MTSFISKMTSALREGRRVMLPFALWLGLTLVTAIAGPFGTYQGLTLPWRLAYWGGVVGASIGLSYAIGLWGQGLAIWQRLLARLIYAALLAGGIHLINGVIFQDASRLPGFVFLAVVVLVVALVIDALIWLMRPIKPTQETVLTAPPDPAETFMRRLPLDMRGRVVRLEAQDHYLNVVTERGTALILLRMADAEAELQNIAGLRVHRSHWVALDQIERHQKRAGRDFLVTSDGSEIPVGRTYRKGAQAAGIF